MPMTVEERRTYQRQYYAANKERLRALNRQSYARRAEDVRQKHAAYRTANRDRLAQRWKAYAAAHPERVAVKARVASKKWREENREKARAAVARWDATHRDAINARRRARYAAGDPMNLKERSARRRALTTGARVEPIDSPRILRDANGRCGICRQPLDLFGIDFDHIIPLARGGTHTVENIQATHARCNRSKGARVA